MHHRNRIVAADDGLLDWIPTKRFTSPHTDVAHVADYIRTNAGIQARDRLLTVEHTVGEVNRLSAMATAPMRACAGCK